jgi:uncharacterized membrane protein
VRFTTQFAVVVVAGIIGFVSLVVGLAVWADWSDGAIVAMVGGIGAVIVNLIVLSRGQQKTADTLVAQDVKLDTITAQTNGLSELERQDIAERAAASVVQQFRGTVPR